MMLASLTSDLKQLETHFYWYAAALLEPETYESEHQ